MRDFFTKYLPNLEQCEYPPWVEDIACVMINENNSYPLINYTSIRMYELRTIKFAGGIFIWLLVAKTYDQCNLI